MNLKYREIDIYDKWLINHGYVCKFSNLKCIENIIDIDEASFDKEKLKNYIISSNKMQRRLIFFPKSFFIITNKKELDSIFNDCIKYIIDF